MYGAGKVNINFKHMQYIDIVLIYIFDMYESEKVCCVSWSHNISWSFKI